MGSGFQNDVTGLLVESLETLQGTALLEMMLCVAGGKCNRFSRSPSNIQRLYERLLYPQDSYHTAALTTALTRFDNRS